MQKSNYYCRELTRQINDIYLISTPKLIMYFECVFFFPLRMTVTNQILFRHSLSSTNKKVVESI